MRTALEAGLRLNFLPMKGLAARKDGHCGKLAQWQSDGKSEAAMDVWGSRDLRTSVCRRAQVQILHFPPGVIITGFLTSLNNTETSAKVYATAQRQKETERYGFPCGRVSRNAIGKTNTVWQPGKTGAHTRHCCMVQSPLDGRSVGGAGAGSIPTCRTNTPWTPGGRVGPVYVRRSSILQG